MREHIRKKNIGRELDPQELATAAGAGWFQNNWLLGYTGQCYLAQNHAYNEAYVKYLVDSPDDFDGARDAGTSASDDAFDNDPACW